MCDALPHGTEYAEPPLVEERNPVQIWSRSLLHATAFLKHAQGIYLRFLIQNEEAPISRLRLREPTGLEFKGPSLVLEGEPLPSLAVNTRPSAPAAPAGGDTNASRSGCFQGLRAQEQLRGLLAHSNYAAEHALTLWNLSPADTQVVFCLGLFHV